MPYKIDAVDIWCATIEDRPGGLSAKLGPLAAAGANLEFVLARRDQPGTGVVFVSPVKGVKATRAAQEAGLAKSAEIAALRIEGPDKPGLGAKLTAALAEAGINLRGLAASATKNRCIVYLAFDAKEDAAKAKRTLAKAL